MKKILTLLVGVVFLLITTPAFAAPGYSLFDNSHLVSGGFSAPYAVETVSNMSLNPAWGGIDFTIPSGTKFSDLTSLSTYYKISTGDCGGGSPRFQINLSTGKNVMVYIGPTPNFTGCTLNTWLSTGELIGSTDLRFDLSQAGGAFYGNYASALSLVGSTEVKSISLITDGGWMSTGTQTILFDNVQINGVLYTFDPPKDKDQCKEDGWKLFNAPSFKNQGDCVSFITSNENALGNKLK